MWIKVLVPDSTLLHRKMQTKLTLSDQPARLEQILETFHYAPQLLCTNRHAMNLTGRRRGRLLVYGLYGPHKASYRWLVRCDCGNWGTITRRNFQSGGTNSCGCLNREQKTNSRLIHGESSNRTATTESRAYYSARVRCNTPSHPLYPNYGGRGIEFRFDSYADFLAAVGRKPSPDLSLDRIDNDGHYEKGNLRWATAKVQTNNRRPKRRRK